MRKNVVYIFVVVGFFLIGIASCARDDYYPNSSTKIFTVQIPAGTFTMGSPTTEANRGVDETQHQVTLSAFQMSKYEISNLQFAAFLNFKKIGGDGINILGPYPTEALIFESSGQYDWGLHYFLGQWVPVAGYEDYPVINVTWFGATEFASDAQGRLPTEAEWEYACRANTTTPFNTGSCLADGQSNYNWAYPYGNCTNTNTIYPGNTKSKGTYTANSYGLRDMHGNVWEWCSDWYGNYPDTPQDNPAGPGTGTYRVIRGGSWNYDAIHCRSAFRGISDPKRYLNSVGFRVVFNP